MDDGQERGSEPAIRGRQGRIRVVDPKQLSRKELERLTRRYTSEIGIVIGPQRDIPAPDVNTDAQIMAWMMDTYSANVGATTTGVVTGKPVMLGGSLGRVKATGRGVYFVAREAARRLHIDIDGARVAIQGFGNVGSVAAEIFAWHGAKIVAVQDHTGTVFDGNGLDVEKMSAAVAQTGVSPATWAVSEFPPSSSGKWTANFLIPAALEGVLTRERASRVRTRVVIEGANGPTTPDADLLLADRGIVVIPDVIANAGGVTVSYFEWVQDFSSFFWTEDEINQRLDRILTGAFTYIWDTHLKHKVSLRTAAFIVACTLCAACQGRARPLSLTHSGADMCCAPALPVGAVVGSRGTGVALPARFQCANSARGQRSIVIRVQFVEHAFKVGNGFNFLL